MRPPTGLSFIPQVIHNLGEPWWNVIDRGKTPDLSITALLQSYQQSSSSKVEGTGEEIDQFCFTNYLFHCRLVVVMG
jgi:hypothetical protein